MTEYEQAKSEALEKAERYGFSFYVFGGYLHVMDGGSRGRDGGDGDGDTDWSGGSDVSYRRASDYETEMWEALT